jgi:hypothetical protein
MSPYSIGRTGIVACEKAVVAGLPTHGATLSDE